MTKKLSILLIALVLFPSFMFAQKHMILRADGTMSPSSSFTNNNEVTPIQFDKKAVHEYFKNNNTLTSLVTVLSYNVGGAGAVQFGTSGRDTYIQWFVAPADMFIDSAGVNFYAGDANQPTAQVKLVKLNWTKSEVMSAGASATHLGWYPAVGNGFNDISPLQDDPGVTDVWNDLSGLGEPFGNDIWSDAGVGATLNIVGSGDVGVHQWVPMSLLSRPDVKGGDVIGVEVQIIGDLGTGDNTVIANNTLGIPGFKFYANGRTSGDLTTAGWWTRLYTWDIELGVDIYGDPGPDITDVTKLATTLDTGDRIVKATITDSNPGGGTSGVDNAEVIYSTDGKTTWNSVTMTHPPIGDVYSGTIPGQAAGTHVDYFVQATDVNANVTQSSTSGYNIFLAENTTLLVFNGFSTPKGYPQQYYFGYLSNTSFDKDVWSYGPLTADLLSNYTNLIYIATKIGSVDGTENEIIRTWLNDNSAHNYALFGDEWIGVQTGWTDGTYAAGDFFYDVLGISADYNDISSVDGGDDGGQKLSSDVQPVQGTLLGGPLANKYTQVSTDSSWTAPLVYAPGVEIGVSNWLDGVDFLSDVEVDMTATARDSSTTHSILGHRTLSAGNKIVFGTYDPLSLDSDPINFAEYDWYGAEFEAPQVTMLDWFGIVTDVAQSNETVPVKYELSQNYPNPFNPSTIIKFSIPSNESVSLKIYNVLGKEVATLVNKTMTAGNYEVNFDASKLSSGMYIYQITAGSFVSAKKMMLLK